MKNFANDYGVIIGNPFNFALFDRSSQLIKTANTHEFAADVYIRWHDRSNEQPTGDHRTSGTFSKSHLKITPIAWKKENARRQIDACKRIKEAVQKFLELRQPFSIRDLKQQAKCSEHTLYKHQNLWKAIQEQLRTDRFASVAHKYNAGVGGVPVQTPPLAASSQTMPPGRLAARRIVHEIASRARREEKRREKDKQQRKTESDNSWKEALEKAIPEDVGIASSEFLKAALVVATYLCQFAPSYEDLSDLQEVIASIRAEFLSRSAALGPHL